MEFKAVGLNRQILDHRLASATVDDVEIGKNGSISVFGETAEIQLNGSYTLELRLDDDEVEELAVKLIRLLATRKARQQSSV